MTRTSLQFCATVVAVALALSVSATASLIVDDGGITKAEAYVPATIAVTTNRAAKTDRLPIGADLEPRQVRCVARDRGTTCTGWPVTGGVQVSGL